MRTRLRFSLPVLAAVLALSATAGCGSSATTATATSPTSITRCAVTGNVSGQVPAQGGSGSLTVSAARECAWSAAAEGQWLSIKTGGNGQGDGSVEFAAVANPDPAVRRGAIVLNDARVEVMQAAGECTYLLSEVAASFSQTGGSGQFEVRASSSLCTWTAQSDAPWVVVRSGGSGKGTATVQFDVAGTTGQPRSATITAAGQRFSVSQQPSGCAFSVAPLTHTAAASGGALTITVATAPTCAWTASTTASWISLASPAPVTGNGTATFNIAASPAPRAGSVVVAGQTVTVNQSSAPQSPACSYSLSATGATLPAEGGAGAVGITAGPSCPWTAASNANWLTITSGTTGSGPGSVAFTAAAQTGGSRSGTLTIAGQTFTIAQAAGCTITISPEVQSVGADGETKTIKVTAPAGCAWTTTSNVPWISIRESGDSGSRDVHVTIAVNAGPARTGTATIGGRTLTINQAAALVCSYKVSPLELKVNEEPRLSKIDIETGSSCSWTAVSNASWIRVLYNESGTGSGDMWIGITENDGKNRTGTLTVAGQTVTVVQKDK